MSEALVYVASAAFLIFIFPIHINNYVYVNTESKYASLNVGVFRFNFYNMNTVKDHVGEMQINGKNKKMDVKKLNVSLYKIFDQLCIYKVIQLGDYGMKKESNAFVALAQNCFTTAIYKFIQVNGNYCKLRNYTIFNEEHSEIRYYAKTVTILNLAVVSKILLIILMEKIYALKN
ncbi:MAG: hypothetical protein K2K80_00880 [Clostridia bacterium]|nr:hypothetical protein [Clostridia bacterium]